ncbi:hypothetical protein EYF80_004929 [Liparis tanakae]|uniref:Uncharacterized protein n=1 Tax=Liparis tanakae TaxID=230148 RepID=A0A4Z2J4R5_9TELE|nr:hypothetical protein EYF80_004929 [Liparis tanakae]
MKVSIMLERLTPEKGQAQVKGSKQRRGHGAMRATGGRVQRADGEHPPASLHGAHYLPRGTKPPCHVKHLLLPLSPAAETGPRPPPVTRLEEGRRRRASRWANCCQVEPDRCGGVDPQQTTPSLSSLIPPYKSLSITAAAAAAAAVVL